MPWSWARMPELGVIPSPDPDTLVSCCCTSQGTSSYGTKECRSTSRTTCAESLAALAVATCTEACSGNHRSATIQKFVCPLVPQFTCDMFDQLTAAALARPWPMAWCETNDFTDTRALAGTP